MKNAEYGISCLNRGTLFLYLLTVFVLQSVTLLAQNDRTIRGTVIDENEEPIIGATVAVRGATVGTVSDIDGNFVLYVEAGKEVWLDVSYIGYKKQEIKTDGNKPLAITLIENMATEKSKPDRFRSQCKL